MTALGAAKEDALYQSPEYGYALPVKTLSTIYEGGMVAVDATGYAIAATNAGSLTVMGVAVATVDNSAGLDGAKSVIVKQGIFCYRNDGVSPVVATDVGAHCFVQDDQTVKHTQGASAIAGTVVAVTTGGVYVMVTPVRLPTSVVTLTGGQTLTNKTLTAPTINNPVIPATEFANADHAHAAANSGGTLDATNCLGATIVPVANGGTGMAGYTAAGRIVYSNGAASLTALAVGTAGKTLRVNAGATAPEWANARLAPGAVLAFGGTTDVQVSVSQGQHFLIPATDGGAATHTISLQLAGAVQGDFMVFTADGAANSQATQYRSVLTNIGGAQTLSKKHGFTAVFNGTAWVCASNYLEP